MQDYNVNTEEATKCCQLSGFPEKVGKNKLAKKYGGRIRMACWLLTRQMRGAFCARIAHSLAAHIGKC